MRVVFLVNRWHRGGIRASIEEQIPWLKASGLDIRVVSVEKAESAGGHPPVSSLTSGSKLGLMGFVKSVFTLRKILRAVRPHIMESIGPRCGILGVLAMPRSHGTRHVHVIHSQERIYSWPVRKALRRIARSWDTILAVSETVKDENIKDRIYDSTDSCRIVVLPNGIDPDVCSRGVDRKLEREKIGAGEAEAVLAFHGRFDASKRVVDLVDLFYRIALELPDSWLILTGDGPEKETVRKRIDARGVGKRVVMRGHLPREEAIHSISPADIYVSMSRLEGLPVSFLEAMACGLPVFAVRYGARADEIVNAESGGALFDANETGRMIEEIVKVARNREEIARRSRLARKFVSSKYDMKQIVREKLKIYESGARRDRF